jgi:hypothetical protein
MLLEDNEGGGRMRAKLNGKRVAHWAYMGAALASLVLAAGARFKG